MIRSLKNISLLLAISLTMGVIWPDFSKAAQAPQLELLGEIKAGLRVPTRIDVDNSGNLFVADARLQQIFKFDKYGTELLVVDQEKVSGAGLAVSPAGDRIYASAFDKVVVFDSAGELIGYVGKGPQEFVAAGSIDLDSDGNIYVVDLNLQHIKVFHPDGTASGLLGGASCVANTSMEIQPSTDNIYFTESFSGSGVQPQISVYDRNAVLQRQLLGSDDFGNRPLQFFGGMAFDNQDRLYITDIEGKTIRILDETGSWLATYDSNVKLSRPGSMVFDADTNRLFVVQADHRIDIYGIDGAKNPVAVNSPPEVPVPVSPIGGSEVASALPSLRFNNSVDADETDDLSYRVRVFDAANTLVTSLRIAEQTSVTSVALDVDLQENDFYRWQVQAFDGQAESDWSELQSFYVNAVQEAPTVPVLVAPLAGAAARTDALLEWQVATDADPFDTVSYLLEVSAGVDFGEILYSEELTVTERQLTDWSGQIEPGQVYHWQITAVDNHGLKTSSSADGSFIYQASLLNVAANMPGTRVYFGGNQGYAGQFIGVAPLKLRDLPEGRYQLTLERAGFEPFFQPVDIQITAPSVIYAELRPALLPGPQAYDPLKVAGNQIKTGSLITPLIADLDLDGIEDLLLSYADGSLHYHPGVLDKQKKGKAKARSVRFAAEKQLSLPQMAGGTPVLVDWNNDYQQDLLIGTADGSVWLFLNQGDFSFTEKPVWLAAVGSAAVPAVADIDADGDKDLLVGSGDGELVLFSNLGTDAEAQLSEPQLLVAFAEAAAPTFADWNGDGQRELLIAAEGQIYQAVYTDGVLAEMKQIAVKGGASVARLFAHDIDGVSGKNLIVGTANGRLLLSHSRKDDKRYVADFYQALEEKLQQLEEALTEENPELLPLLEPLYKKLAQQKMGRLKKRVKAVVAELPTDSTSASVARELANVLSY